MVPANKILTVTYGTFSCTLEGFDDPFTAMTEIAEYFRDLAAKDRYFGAEPPTPDMERLEQITAASMKGPVSADNSSGRLVLRPGEAEPDFLAAVEEKIEEEKASEDQRVDDRTDGRASDDTAIEDGPPAENALADHDDEDDTGDVETATAKLARLRGAAVYAVTEDDSYDLEEEEFDAVDRTSDDDAAARDVPADADPAAPIREDAMSPEEEVLGDAHDSPITPWSEDSTPEDEDAVAEAMTDDAPFEAAPAEIEALEADMAEEAAVEDQPETAIEPDEDVVEDEPVEDPVEDEDRVADGHPIEDEDGISDGDQAEAEDPAATVGEKADLEDADTDFAVTGADVAGAEIETTATVMPDDTRAETDPRAETPADAGTPTEDDDRLTADLAAMFSPRTEEEPDASADQQPAARVTVRKVRKRAAAEDDVAAAAPAAPEDAGDDDADLMAELAAIEAELARDATGATAVGASEEDDYDDDRDDVDAVEDDMEAPAVAEAEAGSDADDRDLLSALAAIEAEATPPTASGDDTTGDGDRATDAEPADTEPNDLERLFAATDSRLSGEDASRRHANISHLKAAVAARRADDTIETEKTDDSGAYRKDLANTVRPRRRSAESADTAEEPRPERGAPLVLISEQRVEPAPEPEQEEAPAAKAPEFDIAEGLSKGLRAPDTGDDFEQFAIDVGAVDLPDVLEAAAVYSATVMGQESFSRPRLLHLAAEAVDDLSREDGLRGFGQLLRDGTIRKVGRGTFTLGTESRFQTKAARRAS